MKIAVAATGYVGLSNAVLLAQHHEVVAVDIIQEKVDLINAKRSPIEDAEIKDFLANRSLNLRDTTERPEAVEAGTVKLVRKDVEKIVASLNQLLTDDLAHQKMSFSHNPYGDSAACQ